MQTEIICGLKFQKVTDFTQYVHFCDHGIYLDYRADCTGNYKYICNNHHITLGETKEESVGKMIDLIKIKCKEDINTKKQEIKDLNKILKAFEGLSNAN